MALGLVAFTATLGAFKLNQTLAWSALGSMFALSVVALTARSILGFMGRHLSSVFATGGAVLGLGVILQFVSLLW